MPDLLRRSIAVYEAARCLIGYMTPYYDEISKVQPWVACWLLMQLFFPKTKYLEKKSFAFLFLFLFG